MKKYRKWILNSFVSIILIVIGISIFNYKIDSLGLFGSSNYLVKAAQALTNGKNMCYLGIEVAMTEEELSSKVYTNYIRNKETIADFYRERYGEDAAEIVKKIFDAREHYLTYKRDAKKAIEIFDAALKIGEIIQYKLFTG